MSKHISEEAKSNQEHVPETINLQPTYMYIVHVCTETDLGGMGQAWKVQFDILNYTIGHLFFIIFNFFFGGGGLGVKERHLYVQAKITLGESLPQMASAVIISFLSR